MNRLRFVLLFVFLGLAFLISPLLLPNFHVLAYVDPGLTTEGSLTNGTTFGFAPQYGDINGDGKQDMIIGSKSYSSFTGRVYVYFGDGTSFSSSPDVTITGEATNNYFSGLDTESSSLAVGDINGDGIDDIVIGAPINSDGGASAGKIYVFYGGPALLGSKLASDANYSAVGNITDKYRFGIGVAILDANNDGKNDIVVAATTGDTIIEGKLYTYLNTHNTFDFNNPSSVLTFVCTPSFLFAYSGISTTGDFDGDGNKDIYMSGNYGTTDARTYFFKGDGKGNFAQASVFTPVSVSDSPGRWRSISSADINGDGKDDFCVGAYTDSTVTSKQGRVYCFFGRSTFDSSYSVTQADIILNGQATNDDFGRATFLYDVTNDGKPDLLVGAYQVDAGTNNRHGKFYIYKNTNGTFQDSPWLSEVKISGNTAYGNSDSATDWNSNGWANITVTQGGTASSGTGDPVLNYYEISHGSPSITFSSGSGVSATLTGVATDTNTDYSISGVEWGTGGTTGGTWTACTPTDGSFNSGSEGFSCDVSGIINNSGQSIYVRTHDQNDLYMPPQLYGTVRTLTRAGASSSCSSSTPQGLPTWIYKVVPGTSGPTGSASSLTLSFTNWQTPVDHFVLEYGTSPNLYQYGSENIGGDGTNSYTVNFLTPNTTYYFRVASANGCSVGDWSNEVKGKTTQIQSLTTNQTPTSSQKTLGASDSTNLTTPTPVPFILAPTPVPTREQVEQPNLFQQIMSWFGNITDSIKSKLSI